MYGAVPIRSNRLGRKLPAMRRLLRLTLTWLLVLALPAQGYAAQAMLFCGPVHAAMAAGSAAATASDHDHAAHGHAVAPSAEAHRHGASSAYGPLTADLRGVDADADADADSHDSDRPHALAQDTGAKAGTHSAGEASSAKCSVCASCCSMVAIAGAIVVPQTLSFPPVYTFSPFEPHASLAAGGLERPPRRDLA